LGGALSGHGPYGTRMSLVDDISACYAAGAVVTRDGLDRHL
jgi:hypothetical protein